MIDVGLGTVMLQELFETDWDIWDKKRNEFFYKWNGLTAPEGEGAGDAAEGGDGDSGGGGGDDEEEDDE